MSFIYNGQMSSMNKETNQGMGNSIKDFSTILGAGTSNMSVTLSYSKTNKLVTALYMVTDIMDTNEPIKNKLRTLGIEILSDLSMSNMSKVTFDITKIEQVVSFLD